MFKNIIIALALAFVAATSFASPSDDLKALRAANKEQREENKALAAQLKEAKALDRIDTAKERLADAKEKGAEKRAELAALLAKRKSAGLSGLPAPVAGLVDKPASFEAGKF